MPRQKDPAVEARILKAAHKLWIRGGDKALSMRAVARAAHTNTPAIYRRFRNRKEIVRALVSTALQELVDDALKPAESLEDLGHRVLDFALAHVREYQLITSGLFSRIDVPRLGFQFTKERSAQWLGGAPEDHIGTVLAVWSLVHGTAMLLITKTVPPEYEVALRTAFTAALPRLVRNGVVLS